MFKNITVSKRNIIKNYENQLKRKDERIAVLKKENLEIKESIEKLIKEYEAKLAEQHSYVNGSCLEQCNEINILKKDNEILNEMTDELIKEVDRLANKKIHEHRKIKNRTKKFRTKLKYDKKIREIENRYL